MSTNVYQAEKHQGLEVAAGDRNFHKNDKFIYLNHSNVEAVPAVDGYAYKSTNIYEADGRHRQHDNQAESRKKRKRK